MELIRDISEELKDSYIDYAMSVIVGRALPDVRDGLKPVQRRILFAMHEMGLTSAKPFRKCARVVGEVLGKYHPHGDAAVYDALVRLAQNFVMRYTLVEGQGNFGSIDGDSAAAMRYTEARLTKLAEEMLADISKDTVNYVPNFDSTLKEPAVLPSKIPNLLINGCSGIAVGMATNIPPHNLKEVCDAIIAFIRNPEISVDELMTYIKGPDFPTGGVIVGVEGISSAYKTGRGRIIVRGKAEIDKNKIIIREIPYLVNKSRLVESIAELAKEGKINEIKGIRDESDREGIRIVIEVKGKPDLVLKKLYAYSNLQTTFGVINLALVQDEPKILNLKELISHYVEHRREVTRRKIRFELKNARRRLHVLEGFIKIIEDLDTAIKLIRDSKSPTEAKKSLSENYNLTDVQAQEILKIRLEKLTKLEIHSIKSEYRELLEKIAEYENILSDPKRIDDILISELNDIKNKYGDNRRTEILPFEKEIDFRDLIESEENIIVVTDDGLIKRINAEAIEKRTIGNVGQLDAVSVLTSCKSDQKLLLFTALGKAYWINAYEIPESEKDKGVSLRRYIKLMRNDKIVSVIGLDDFKGDVIVLSPDGYVKRVSSSEFENAKRAGIRASSSRILHAIPLKGEDVIIATRKGRVLRLKASEIPKHGRNARGVIAIRLRDDEICSISNRSGEFLITLTENGFAKRTNLDEFRILSRGSMGVASHKINEKSGKLVLAEICNEGKLIILERGNLLSIELNRIPLRKRNSLGVRVSKKGVRKAFVYAK